MAKRARTAPASSVRIRMYRGILGDCFLIQASVDGATKSILIDCGVLQNVPSGEKLLETLDKKVVDFAGRDALAAIEAGPDRIRAVVADLLETVGYHIDLLVLTHEHYDHLSGFALMKEAFTDPRLRIDRLWLAWTENPEDPQAAALQALFGKGRQALARLAAATQLAGAQPDEKLASAAALAAFMGPQGAGMGAAGAMTTRATIEMLKARMGSGAISYLEPGRVIDLSDLGLRRAFVLGPPRDECQLRKDAPTPGEATEVYLTNADYVATVDSALRARFPAHGADDDGALASYGDDAAPFARPHLRPTDSVRNAVGSSREGAPDAEPASVAARYFDQSNDWRRIDGEWTAAVESLALKLDSDTNNTSLALAFELDDGQMLLFPGDAQVGNWLSWRNQTYPHPRDASNAAEKPLSIDDILRCVTFYKVGHHASHNATLDKLGLEKMTDRRLIAAIPVVEAVAAIQAKGRKTPGKGWKMPYRALYARLQEKTNGRIVRGDGVPAEEQRAFRKSPTDPKRPASLAYATKPEGLWVEIAIPTGEPGG